MRELSFFPEKCISQGLRLANLEESECLGKRLADGVREANPGALLFFGSLGMGKTTLCRAMVTSLPGGDEAEISSPSFTICNIYCTEPAVHHFDFYRLQPGMVDEALYESLDNPMALTVVEWAERLALKDFPPDGVALRLSRGRGPMERQVDLAALGPLGDRFLASVFG